MITLETIAAQLVEVSSKLDRILGAQPSATADILTRTEAMVYVKKNNRQSFSVWCREYHVKPFNRGRYSRTQLDLALSREARRRG